MKLQDIEAAYKRLYEELEHVTTAAELDAYLTRHLQEYQLDNLLTERGDALIRQGETVFGMELILAAYEHPTSLGVYWDDTTLFLRLAQYYIEKGETETGKQFLMRICTDTADNYEQAINYRKLGDVWEKYKPLIQDDLPEPKQENCSMEIGEILAQSGSQLLLELGIHVNELSDHGNRLQKLNQWERVVYDLDTLSDEINSGGIDCWLSYHGTRYTQTLKAAEKIGAVTTVSLLERIRKHFPGKEIPKSQFSIENSLEDIIAEGKLDFDKADDDYFDTAEPELLEKLEQFIRQNSRHFR